MPPSVDRAIHLHSGVERARREAAGRGAIEGSGERTAGDVTGAVATGTRMDRLLPGANSIYADTII